MSICTADYCDTHDYPVAAPWCQRAWMNRRQRETPSVKPAQLRKEIQREREQIYEEFSQDLREKPPYSDKVRNPSYQDDGNTSMEVNYKWNR